MVWFDPSKFNFVIMRHVLILAVLLLSLTSFAQQARNTENVFIITFDGLRWEELFAGAVDSIMTDPASSRDTTELLAQFRAPMPAERRAKLLPFFWSTIARDGQLYGNRWKGNKVNVTNGHWFSYPGYNEILTGRSDPRINSNDKIPNPNVTVLEWINRQPGFQGRVAAFGSWDVFPFIINEERSGVPVNAGYEAASGNDLSVREIFLNELQPQIPGHWSTVRHDAFTHHYALEYIKRKQPRVVYIAYGETDDFAHDGRYDHYLKSAHQTDAFIRELWTYVQSTPAYRNKTTFLVTTDHGRGADAGGQWRSHGTDYVGADAIWFAVLGPDTPALGQRTDAGQWYQNQIAKTAARFLNLDYAPAEGCGEVVKGMFK